MKVVSRNPFKSSVCRVFAHLSDDERIDQACELLAEGVFRLAEKRGLLEHQKDSADRVSAKAKETA